MQFPGYYILHKTVGFFWSFTVPSTRGHTVQSLNWRNGGARGLNLTAQWLLKFYNRLGSIHFVGMVVGGEMSGKIIQVYRQTWHSGYQNHNFHIRCEQILWAFPRFYNIKYCKILVSIYREKTQNYSASCILIMQLLSWVDIWLFVNVWKNNHTAIKQRN